jgi:hypothetical protein
MWLPGMTLRDDIPFCNQQAAVRIRGLQILLSRYVPTGSATKIDLDRHLMMLTNSNACRKSRTVNS